jgi:zinc protease
VIFDGNAYAYPTVGTTKSLKAMKRSDLLRHYLKYYRPNNTLLAIVGDFDASFEKNIEAQLSKWESRPVDEPKFKAPLDPEKPIIHLASQQGLQQTQIQIGYPSIRRDDPDYIKMRVANMILGGAFASRLNQRVRDDLGLTYGIFSGINARKNAGDFTISTFTRNDKVGETLTATLDVFRKYASEGVKDAELRAAKNLMIGQFPQSIETTDKIAFNLLVLRFFKISDDYLKNFVPNIENVSLTDVNQIIKTQFFPEKLQMVIYGDKDAIKAQLEKVAPVKEVALDL